MGGVSCNTLAAGVGVIATVLTAIRANISTILLVVIDKEDCVCIIRVDVPVCLCRRLYVLAWLGVSVCVSVYGECNVSLNNTG